MYFDLIAAYSLIGDGFIYPGGCYENCKGPHRCCQRRLIYSHPAERGNKSFRGCYRCPGYRRCVKPLICRLYPVVGDRVDQDCSESIRLPSEFVSRAIATWDYVLQYPEGRDYLYRVRKHFNLSAVPLDKYTQ